MKKEKGITKELLFEAIESVLISAYKKNYGVDGNVEVKIDRELGDIDVIAKKEVVAAEDLEDEDRQISLEEARAADPAFEVGDQAEYHNTPKGFGRIAAQTAKQVVVQRIREAERGMIFDDYIEKMGEVITGTVQRKSNDTIFVNMGRTEGLLSVKEQVQGERFDVNERIKVYIMDFFGCIKRCFFSVIGSVLLSFFDTVVIIIAVFKNRIGFTTQIGRASCRERV